jgi:hypothetical protein
MGEGLREGDHYVIPRLRLSEGGGPGGQTPSWTALPPDLFMKHRCDAVPLSRDSQGRTQLGEDMPVEAVTDHVERYSQMGADRS